MTLAEIRANVADNAGPKLNTGQQKLNRVINRAVAHVVNLMEQTGECYNMAVDPKTISVVAGTKSYQVDGGGVKIRKIVHVERTDGGSDPVDVEIIPFDQKNYYTTRSWPYTGSAVPRPVVYFARERDGKWYMVFPTAPTSAMTIDVYYSPPITELSADGDIPTEIPEEHHNLVVLQATVWAMMQNDPPLRAEFWEEQRQTFEANLFVALDRWSKKSPTRRPFSLSR